MLSATQLQRIAKMVLEEGRSQRDVAEVCNVKPAMVRDLVKTVRLAGGSYATLTANRDAKRAKREVLVEAVKAYLE